MNTPVKSRRGVYYDLNASPYKWETFGGDVFKFSSNKKLQMFRKRLFAYRENINKMMFKFQGLGVKWKTQTFVSFNKEIPAYIYEDMKPNI
jgi:hypothetical protein